MRKNTFKRDKLKKQKPPMYNYWRNNKNIVMTAVALFFVSLTVLLSFLADSGDHGGSHGSLSANVVDSIMLKSQQEQEKNYRSILGEHDGPLVVVGSDGIISFTSWDFEVVTGYKTSQIKGELFYTFIHPEDLSLFVSSFGRALTLETPVNMVGPYRMRSADGQYRFYMASLYPMGQDEHDVSIAIALRDITQGVSGDGSGGGGEDAGEGESIKDGGGGSPLFNEDDDDVRLIVELN